MKTDNEFIAEFYCKQLNLKGAGLKDNHYYFGSIPVTYAHKSQLKFNTSWDWLMPVVEKINNIDLSEFNYDAPRMSQMRLRQAKLQQFSITTPMRIIYPIVVDICKWYNSIKCLTTH